MLRINTLSMTNFKTYESVTFEFTTGHNVIVGDNGAGKSSIFEAISFALFGSVIGKKNHSLIRHGKQRMNIQMIFEVDGAEFRVEREMRNSTADATLYRGSEVSPIASKPKAVLSEIETLLGIDAKIFFNVIYIRQGLISAIASERPADRKQLFDSILGYNNYKFLNERLRGINKSTSQEVENNRERIQELETDLQEKDIIYQEIEELTVDHKELEKQLQCLFPRLTKLTKEFEGMQEISEKIKSLEQQKNLNVKDCKNKINQQETLIMLIEKSLETKIDNIDISQLKQEQEELDVKIDDLTKIVDEGKSIKMIILNDEKMIQNNKSKISDIESKIKSVETLPNKEEITSDIIILEDTIKQLQVKEKDELTLKQQEKSILKNLKDIQQDLQQFKNRMSTIENWEEEYPKLLEIEFQKQIEEKNENYASIEEKQLAFKNRVNIANNDITKDEKSLKSLEDSDNVNCPVCDKKLSAASREKLIIQRTTAIKENKKIINNCEKEIKNHEKMLKKIKTDIKKLDSEERKISSLEETFNSIEIYKIKETDIELKLKGIRDKLKKFKNVSTKIKSGEKDLKKLRQILSKVEKKDMYIDQLTGIKKDTTKIQEELKKGKNNILFLSLEENVQELKIIEKRNRILLKIIPDMNIYIQRKKEINNLQETISNLEKSLDTLDKNFDRNRYNKLENEIQQHRDNKVRMETNINNIITKQIPEKQKQLKLLEKKDEQVIKLKRKNMVLENKLDSVLDIRKFSKEIVPFLRRQHVNAITEYSSEIFSYLINSDEYDGIEVSEDYELKLIKSGHKYDLTILSGGEQVIACLAIRLAIAKLLANQDILLLDEPTIMLDIYKRRELVLVFENTRPVRQTIIVTHDSEFEKVADTTFTVIKKAGRAKVIAEDVDEVVATQKKIEELTKQRFAMLEL